MNGASILITGGTGSFGQRLVETLLALYDLKRVVVFSRDELKQSQMAQADHSIRDSENRLRFFLGDVRDQDRLRRAMEGIDTVVHAAALKQVPASEYNQMEFVKTNILGTQNVIEAPLDTGAKRVAALSTGKEAAPIADIARRLLRAWSTKLSVFSRGEKIYEEMVTPSNSFSTVDFGPSSLMLACTAVPTVSVRKTTNRGRRGSRIRSIGGRSDERQLNTRKSRDGRSGPGPSLEPTECRNVDASQKILSRRRMTKAPTP